MACQMGPLGLSPCRSVKAGPRTSVLCPVLRSILYVAFLELPFASALSVGQRRSSARKALHISKNTPYPKLISGARNEPRIPIDDCPARTARNRRVPEQGEARGNA